MLSFLFLVAGVAALALAVVLPLRALLRWRGKPLALPPPDGVGRDRGWLATSGSLAVAGMLCLFAGTSIVQVGADEVGLLRKIYGGRSLPAGRVIATNGENGFQAQVLPPGVSFRPLIRLTHNIDLLPMVEIPNGAYGRMQAADGAPMPADQVLADSWPEDLSARMLDATFFLGEERPGAGPRGQRGAQTSILKPGRYPLNLYLFRVEVRLPDRTITYDRTGPHVQRQDRPQVDLTSVIEVPAGHVGVVKSNVSERGRNCAEERAPARAEALSVALVPNGCRGVWREALLPGAYYMNRDAYAVTLVDVRLQTWEYKGGYDERRINLTVDQRGEIQQSATVTNVPMPREAADRAVMVRVEGWDVPQELRVLVQVTPQNAPFVVASVGGLAEIEDRVITPMIRSVVRNVVGSEIEVGGTRRPTRVLDLIDHRDAIETTIERLVREEAAKAGLEVNQLRLGESVLPPELLVARRREQLAQQLRQAYQQETIAQEERVKTEQARATADQQRELVRAQIAVQVSERTMVERQNLGEAERRYLESLAHGQEAQANVLGPSNALLLQALQQVLATLREKPELISLAPRLVPQTLVTGGGTGLEGIAAMLRGPVPPEAAPVPTTRPPPLPSR